MLVLVDSGNALQTQSVKYKINLMFIEIFSSFFFFSFISVVYLVTCVHYIYLLHTREEFPVVHGHLIRHFS